MSYYGYKYNLNRTGRVPVLHDRLVSILVGAIKESERICRREKVRAVSRHERVGVFVTTLRRDLNSYKEPFYVKDLWDDIGVLRPNAISYRREGFDMAKLISCVDEANRIVASSESYSEQVEDSLLELNSCLTGVNITLKSMLTINSEADKIITSLRQALVEETV
jgi:hypothetical protein